MNMYMYMYAWEWSTARVNGYEDVAATVLVTAHRTALRSLYVKSPHKSYAHKQKKKTTLLTTIQMKKQAL